MNLITSVITMIDRSFLGTPESINVEFNVFWFRRDMRLSDNAGLFHALKQEKRVLPLFIFDTDILGLLEDKDDRRLSFIYDALKDLNHQLQSLGSSLIVAYGKPEEVFKEFISNGLMRDVYANEDYEPYGINRDEKLKHLLLKSKRRLHLFKDHLIFAPGEILKADQTPYTIYTPFAKKWKEILGESNLNGFPNETWLSRFIPIQSTFPALHQLGFKYTPYCVPNKVPDPQLISNYHLQRDFPAENGTSRLGPHLRFGTLSLRAMVKLALEINQTWLGELIWREFFAHILYHFPHVTEKAFKPAYDRIEWIRDDRLFEHWSTGTTGYPLVDAGMRELVGSGFMHNRVRMVAAGFLSKHLLIDWRWGEAWFARYLLDFELASNNGNWQWAAGTGCDAAPYFRIFNPMEQQRKFDAHMEYIRKWIPEYGTKAYPSPIVDHAYARQRCLTYYKNALT